MADNIEYIKYIEYKILENGNRLQLCKVKNCNSNLRI